MSSHSLNISKRTSSMPGVVDGDNQTVVDIPMMQQNIDNCTASTQMLASHNKVDNENLKLTISLNLLTPNQIDKVVKDAKNTFATNKTKDVKFRKDQLRKLDKMIVENEAKICEALKADLNKPPFETVLGETALLRNELAEFMYLIDDYVKPQHKSKTMLTFFDDLYVKNEPLGTVLIMGAWNYPLLLSLSPLAGAIAAGNCVVLKMSEHAPATGALVADLVGKYLDTSCYKVVNCDLDTSKYLLVQHKFDHIFYTGGENGGRAVYEAATKNLTPIVLELGGKSPVYIDDDVCDRDAVWSRLFWGKFLNAGQTCIAPDYVLCSEKAQLVAKKQFNNLVKEFYNGDVAKSENFTRIVNFQHFDRLKKLVKNTSGTVIGGKLDSEKLLVEPTIVLDVSMDDVTMQEEIFGPILPFVTCSSPQKAIDLINSRPKPLALYVFSDSKKVQDSFLTKTTSGGVTINDTILHISAACLPFGGVGGSGFGKYHGVYSLDTFSNSRSVLARGFSPLLEMIGKSRYPPYNNTKLKTLVLLGLNLKFWTPGPILSSCMAFGTGVASVFAYQFIQAANLF